MRKKSWKYLQSAGHRKPCKRNVEWAGLSRVVEEPLNFNFRGSSTFSSFLSFKNQNEREKLRKIERLSFFFCFCSFPPSVLCGTKLWFMASLCHAIRLHFSSSSSNKGTLFLFLQLTHWETSCRSLQPLLERVSNSNGIKSFFLPLHVVDSVMACWASELTLLAFSCCNIVKTQEWIIFQSLKHLPERL